MYNPENRIITTERLILRPFAVSDADDLVKQCNNHNIFKTTLNMPYPYSLEDALSWISLANECFDNNRRYDFVVSDKITGKLLGSIGISNNQTHKNGELGYWIGEEFWNKGYGTEAAKAILEFVFSEIGLHKVMGHHFASNPSSGKIMEKIGMSYEGTLIDQVIKDGKFETLIRYGIINSRA
ncbi:MAG: GNAT family N-acetyltransferase [Defluviitaleaceae bacterium]|nr:GNAT family N-acetyltransferase [Defluviitaleaceae bacterium]